MNVNIEIFLLLTVLNWLWLLLTDVTWLWLLLTDVTWLWLLLKVLCPELSVRFLSVI